MIGLDSKNIKAIYDFNQITKNVFSHYYLRYNGDAAAPPLYHKGEDVLSFTTTTLPIYEFFDLLGVPPQFVLFIDSVALYKALNKKKKVSHAYILENMLYVVTENEDAAKKTDWVVTSGKVHVPVARIESVDDTKRSFDMNAGLKNPDLVFIDRTPMVEGIMDKQLVRITHPGGGGIIIAKPLIPGITNKSELHVSFQPHKQGENKVHIRISKEQVFNYHTYIVYSIFS